MTTTNCTRRGWSRADLLATAFVVLVVGGLLTPALARVRSLSIREKSKNNLKKIGDALQQYHTTFGFFPSNGGRPRETVVSPEVCTVYPNGAKVRWGFGDPKRAGRLQTGSYAYAILPYIGQETAFRKQAHNVAVPSYYHPGRRDAIALPIPAVDPLHPGRTFIGSGLQPWGRTDYAANDRVIRPRMGQVMNKKDIGDGLAETVLVGEKAMDLRDIRAGAEFWDQGILLGGHGVAGRKHARLFRDSAKLFEDIADNWGSPDAAGVQFLFADNHVRMVNYKVPTSLMGAMLSPNGDDDADYEKYLVP